MKKLAHFLLTEMLPRSPIFTTAEVADACSVSVPVASRDLALMAAEGTVTRVRRGIWALTGHPDFSPHAVVPFLFTGEGQAYVSLLSALNLTGMIEQVPRRVQLVSATRRADLHTSVAVYEIHTVAAPLYGGFKPYGKLDQFDLATPEKALFDTLYLSAQKGRRFRHLPELTIPPDFSDAEVTRWVDRIQNVLLRRCVMHRWELLAASRQTGSTPHE